MALLLVKRAKLIAVKQNGAESSGTAPVRGSHAVPSPLLFLP